MNLTIFFYIFLIIINRIAECGKLICPSNCACYTWMEVKRTDCVNKNLVNTNIGIPYVTQVLDLSRNVISILHGNEFQDAYLNSLKIINLSFNQIQEIHKLSFNGLKNLENLDLSHNSIRFLEPETFKSNPNLRILNISHNHLGIINNRPLLTDVPSLQILNMAHCSLVHLSKDLFQNLNYLQFLNISDNLILKIDVEVLDPLIGLTEIDFSKNDIVCNDDARKLLKKLNESQIHFQPFCQIKKSEKIILKPTIQDVDEDMLLVDFVTSTTKTTPALFPTTPAPQKDGVFQKMMEFFAGVPSFYAALCGIQLGLIFGSIFTYCCFRKRLKKPEESPPVPLRTTSLHQNRNRGSSFTERASRIFDRENDELYQELIGTTTPPETPPSPYRSVIDS